MRTPTARPRHRSWAGPVAGLLVGALALTACSGSEDDGAAAQASNDPRATIGTVETWPLTGLEAKSGNAEQKWPALVVKMDNTYSSAPQRGLGSADLVVEELVEGGLTRLAAFFYSDIPGEVGPVRSMRASDIGIVSPVDGTMVTSGAAAVTIGRLNKAGVPFVQEGSAGFYRDSGRTMPYNLMADLKTVAKASKHKATRPDNYLPWGDAALPKGKPARGLTASFSGGHTTEWSYRGGHYVNVNSYAAQGDEFLADNVLVLRVKVGDAGYRDPAGNPVPETQFVGKGQAMLFRGGRQVVGTWSKKSLTAPLELTTKQGTLEVPPGHTWIELVPAADGDVTTTP